MGSVYSSKEGLLVCSSSLYDSEKNILPDYRNEFLRYSHSSRFRLVQNNSIFVSKQERNFMNTSK